MSDLELTDHVLEQLKNDLLHVSIAFSGIERVSDDLAHAVGHDGLEGKVRDFSSKWDDRRKTIIESLDALWKAAGAIRNTFDEVDVKMGNALTKGGS